MEWVSVDKRDVEPKNTWRIFLWGPGEDPVTGYLWRTDNGTRHAAKGKEWHWVVDTVHVRREWEPTHWMDFPDPPDLAPGDKLQVSRVKKHPDQMMDTTFRFFRAGGLEFVVQVPDEQADAFEAAFEPFTSS